MKAYRPLIILTAALVVLVAVYIIFSSLNKSTDDSTPPAVTDAPVYTVADIDISTLTAIDISARSSVGVDSFSYLLNSAGDSWLMKGHEDLPLSNTVFAGAINALITDVSDTVLSADAAASYGFDSPNLSLTVTDGAGTRIYQFGTFNQHYSAFYFRCVDEPSTVYLVGSDAVTQLTYLCYPAAVIEAFEFPDLSVGKVKALTVASGETVSRFEYSADGVWERQEATDGEISADITSALEALAFSSLVSYDKSDREKYGLENPVTVKIDYTEAASQSGIFGDGDASLTLLIGSNDENGMPYAAVDGEESLIYLLNTDIFRALLQ